MTKAEVKHERDYTGFPISVLCPDCGGTGGRMVRLHGTVGTGEGKRKATWEQLQRYWICGRVDEYQRVDGGLDMNGIPIITREWRVVQKCRARKALKGS